MNLTDSSILIDSSVWISYFFGESPSAKEYLENEKIVRYSSAISLHEVKKKFLRSGHSEEETSAALQSMKKKSIVVDADEIICEKSADDSVKLKLHASDSIIYRTAVENKASLITMDAHFKNLENVIMI